MYACSDWRGDSGLATGEVNRLYEGKIDKEGEREMLRKSESRLECIADIKLQGVA